MEEPGDDSAEADDDPPLVVNDGQPVKGIGFEFVGIVIAVSVFLFVAIINSAPSHTGQTVEGTDWQNFLNMLGASGAAGLTGLLLLVFVPIFFFSAAGIVRKSLATRAVLLRGRV